jgi:hypothetical protein
VSAKWGFRSGELVGKLEEVTVCVQFGSCFRVSDEFGGTKEPGRGKRIRNLGLMPYVGETLFCRTMNSEGELRLSELTDEELAGALVVVDTAVRFIEGDENSSEDMKVFANDCFRLIKAGATVLVLFHSLKGTKDATELTLENSVRGSGDFGLSYRLVGQRGCKTRMQDGSLNPT